jgi:plastocyanin
MDTSVTRSHASTHRSLSTLGKSTIAGLFGVALFFMLIWTVIRSVPFFLLMIAITLACAGLTLTKIRWMPFISSVVCGIFLYLLLIPTPFAFAHFIYPRSINSSPWLSFIMFSIVAGAVWCMVTTAIVGISASIYNYRNRQMVNAPSWYPFLLTAMAGVLLGVLLLGSVSPTHQATSSAATQSTSATTQSNSSAATTTSVSSNGIVHMGQTTFSQSSITIAKGGKLKLINDSASYHILANGSWINGQAVLQSSTGGPAVKNVGVANGTSITIGPFTNAGTYHLLCTVHPNMNLTIIVK